MYIFLHHTVYTRIDRARTILNFDCWVEELFKIPGQARLLLHSYYSIARSIQEFVYIESILYVNKDHCAIYILIYDTC